jgi:hypothetical protein
MLRFRLALLLREQYHDKIFINELKFFLLINRELDGKCLMRLSLFIFCRMLMQEV